MTLWIRLITCSRLPLATAVALCWMSGNFEAGALYFVAGLLTKAVDTPLSVWRRCPIPADDWLYRMMAVLFNAAAVLGLTGGFCANPAKIPTFLAALPILPLIVAGGIMASRLFVKPHSLLAKARSGLISAVVVFFMATFVPFWLSFTCIGMIWAGEGFKILYYKDNPIAATL